MHLIAARQKEGYRPTILYRTESSFVNFQKIQKKNRFFVHFAIC